MKIILRPYKKIKELEQEKKELILTLAVISGTPVECSYKEYLDAYYRAKDYIVGL